MFNRERSLISAKGAHVYQEQRSQFVKSEVALRDEFLQGCTGLYKQLGNLLTSMTVSMFLKTRQKNSINLPNQYNRKIHGNNEHQTPLNFKPYQIRQLRILCYHSWIPGKTLLTLRH